MSENIPLTTMTALRAARLLGVAAMRSNAATLWAERWGLGPKIVDVGLAVLATQAFHVHRVHRSRHQQASRLRDSLEDQLRRMIAMGGCTSARGRRSPLLPFIWASEVAASRAMRAAPA